MSGDTVFIELTCGAAAEPVTFNRAFVQRIERNIQWTSGDSERTHVVEHDGNKTWVRESYEEVLSLLRGEAKAECDSESAELLAILRKADERMVEALELQRGRKAEVPAEVRSVVEKLRTDLEMWGSRVDRQDWRVLDGETTNGDLAVLVSYFDGRG